MIKKFIKSSQIRKIRLLYSRFFGKSLFQIRKRAVELICIDTSVVGKNGAFERNGRAVLRHIADKRIEIYYSLAGVKYRTKKSPFVHSAVERAYMYMPYVAPEIGSKKFPALAMELPETRIINKARVGICFFYLLKAGKRSVFPCGYIFY